MIILLNDRKENRYGKTSQRTFAENILPGKNVLKKTVPKKQFPGKN